ncbi:MAG: DUF1549 and DUF1553 domain-containing protein [Gemmataceae bacterium]|nr:DUF1549 and DUF1553 domain-containing protein [Gemmataceae bacterium]
MTIPSITRALGFTFAFTLGLASTARAEAPPLPVEKPTERINDLIAAKWKENRLDPAGPVDDLTYLRRVCIQVIGRIPTVDEIFAFEKDGRADKRARLVERLLATEEYTDYWGEVWAERLLGEGAEPAYKEQLQAWVKKSLAAKKSHKELATALLTAEGRSDVNPAVLFVLSHLGKPLPADRVARDGQHDMVPIAGRVPWLFLGLQLQCAQCHCHPYNADVKDKHFWGMNAFFRQAERRELVPATNHDPAILELRDNFNLNSKGLIFFEKRSGVFVPIESTFIDGRKLPRNMVVNRRKALAEFITGHDNFALAHVNRTWAHFFGRGMNEMPEAGDFGEHNPVLHPELLAGLAGDFVAAHFDDRKLIRWICASDAYQLKGVVNRTNEDDDKAVFFSRTAIRPLSFDQMFASVLMATRLADKLGKGERREMRQRWREDLLLRLDENGIDEKSFREPTTESFRLMLQLMNGKEVNRAIFDRQTGAIPESLAREKPATVIDRLYLATLTRYPTVKERELFEELVRKERIRDARADLVPVWQDLFWALLNSSEFLLKQ